MTQHLDPALRSRGSADGTRTAGPVLFEKLGGGIARVTLNRPEVRNAVNGPLASALGRTVQEIEADPEIHVAVLTGAGQKAFCAGADLSEIARGNEATLWTAEGGFAGFVDAVRSKVWIAAVKGFALAGGLELLLACDLVVASEDAVFALPEVRRGLIPGAGGLYRLPKAIPRAVAIEMIVTGDPVRAVRARDLGLINRVVATDRVDEEALALARTIAGNAPRAVRESLNIARIAGERPEAELRRMSDAAFATIKDGEDMREGAQAFLEKRAPRWSGR